MKYKSINPFDNSIIEEFDELSASQVNEKLSLASAAFSNWKKTSFAERSLLMGKVAEVLKKNETLYAETMTREMGKPLAESRAEVEKCAWVCEHFASEGEEFLKDEIIKSDADKSWIKYQPLGTVLAIMPWNFPFWQVFRFAAPNLMAGNTAILKHASNVLRSAKHIEDIFLEAGFPEGVFQHLIISIDQVNELIADPVIKAVTLTGSEHAGSSAASIAGKHIKKTVLELGGSNAFIVLKDADLDAAVKDALQSRMANAGQSCIAAKRFIVVDEIREEFTNRLQEKIEALKSGDPFDRATNMGPLARVDLAEHLEKQVNDSIAQGAVLRCGGKRNGAFYAPTLLTGVKPGMPAFDDELFGPVAPIIAASDEDEALMLANKTSFGLGATVFTQSKKSAERFINDIEDGACFINSIVKSDPRLPFGGTKRSGYGRELSIPGIREFMNIKTVYTKGIS